MDHFFMDLSPSDEPPDEQPVVLRGHKRVQKNNGNKGGDPVVPVRQLQIIFDPRNYHGLVDKIQRK